jgi:hypothetical protein
MSENDILGGVACPCGAILDVGGYAAPGGGSLISDPDYVEFSTTVIRGFAEFLVESKAGRRDDWIRRQFGSGDPCDKSDAAYLEEFVHHQLACRSRTVSECHKCGRLLVDTKQSDVFEWIGYSPDDGGYRGMLGGYNQKGSAKSDG